MAKQIPTWTLLVCCSMGSAAMAPTAEDYVAAGRSEMTAGTSTGFAEAYLIFDAGINDANCPDCASDRELVFLRAVTRTMALFVDYRDVVAADDLLDLAEKFGMAFEGIAVTDLNAVLSCDGAGTSSLSLDADADAVGQIVHDAVLPELDSIIADLDTITDSPTPFVIYFTPSETGLKADLEVDYGEVLVLKGLLLGCRSLLKAQTSDDLRVEVADMFGSDANTGAVQKDPHLLTISATSRDVCGGEATVAQITEDLTGAIGCWLDAIDYIISEDDPPGTDWQGDELLYFDPDTRPYIESIQARLRAARDVLHNRAAAGCTVERVMTYAVYDAGAAYMGELALAYDFTGRHVNDGWFTSDDGTVLHAEWVTIESTDALMIELSAPTQWVEGWFEGTINVDRRAITDGRFEYWGDRAQTLSGVTAERTDSIAQSINLAPNLSVGVAGPVDRCDLVPPSDAEDSARADMDLFTQSHDGPACAVASVGVYQPKGFDLVEFPILEYRSWFPPGQAPCCPIGEPEREKLETHFRAIGTEEDSKLVRGPFCL